MTIVSLRKKGNNVEITFDDSSRIVIGYEIVVKNALRKNDELTDAKLKELEEDGEKLKIKENVFRLLARRDHSAFELRRKLFQKRYRKELIYNVIDELTEKEYINDSGFAESFYKERLSKKGYGENKLRADLIKKGIDRKIIDSVIEANRDPDLLLNNAIILAEKKLNYLQRTSKEKRNYKQKIFSFLLNKGFDSDTIREVFRRINLDVQED